MDDLPAALGTTQLFHGLSDEGLRRVGAIASEERYARGHVIFREGDLGDKLYLILEGKIRISRQVPGMGEEALAVLGPGEAFGEMSLFDDVPRSADAIVNDNARLLMITRDRFDELLFVQKDLAYEILWNCVRILTTRLRESNEKMALLSVSGKF